MDFLRGDVSSMCKNVVLFFQKQNQAGVPVCTECLGTDVRNRQGVAEALISCSQCVSYAHPSCLDLLEHVTSSVVKVGLIRDILSALVSVFVIVSLCQCQAKLNMT